MPSAVKKSKVQRPPAARPMTVLRTPTRALLASLDGLVLDCDGVLTDGGLYYDNSGARLLRFDAHDSYGLACFNRAGLRLAILSGRPIEIVAQRVKELGVSVCVGKCGEKGTGFLAVCAELGLDPKKCAMVGDDVPDLPAFALCGLSIATANAVAEVKAAATWVTLAQGGHGAVREVCEQILRAKGQWPVSQG